MRTGRVRREQVLGAALAVSGVCLFALASWVDEWLKSSVLKPLAPHVAFTLAMGGLAAVLASYFMMTGRRVRIRIPEVGEIDAPYWPDAEPATRKPPPATLAARKAYSASKPLPGGNAPTLKILEDRRDLRIGPGADPTVPSYVLDRNFRIVDWNEAFSLCFDRTMEGRRGMSVSEWTYFLDNYEEVVDHGIRVFGGEKPLPAIDVETIRYKSMKYGAVRAIKRAYLVPDDEGQCAGWLILLDVEFANTAIGLSYQRDRVAAVARDVMWSEYALSYDTILMNTQIYPELIAEMLGEKVGQDGGMQPIPRRATVLDLGAGTGNVTERLVADGGERLVVALENNRTMLAVLRAKVRPHLRTNGDGPGVVTVKQDITTLLGLEDEYFDVAIMNNVLYAVEDVPACLREVQRVLRHGGEVRISGPQKRTRLDRVLAQIKRDLKARGVFDDVSEDYERVKAINERRLAQWLYRWDIEDMRNMLTEAGFSETFYADDRAYGGESMVVGARK